MKIAFASLAALAAAAAFAQTPPRGRMGPPGGRPGAMYMNLFDPATVTTMTGEVVSIEHRDMMRRMRGVHAIVRTASGDVEVHLGPDWFVENQELKLQKGDQVEVRGSKVEVGGKPNLIAIEVKRGQDTLKLRDEQGVPVWVAWRRP